MEKELNEHRNKLKEVKVAQISQNRKLNEQQIEQSNLKMVFDRLWHKFSSRVGYLVNF